MKIKNPKIKINSEVDLIGMIVLDNSNIVVYPTISGSFELVAIRDQDGLFFAYIGSNQVFEVEDLVNCTTIDGDLYVTDPTKDASCTIVAGSPS